MISAHAATLKYNDHEREVYACRDIDLEVAPGEFLGILGPSGSGKSSLLYLLSGLKVPTSGMITVDGQDLVTLSDAQRSDLRLKSFGFVFQQPYLLGYLSALENVIVASDTNGAMEEGISLLEKLGLGQKLNRLPHELSGGERQRVCVARALMGSPRAVFADEPTAALDHTNGAAVVNLLHENRGQSALVMVTHDPTMLGRADRVISIAEGQILP